MSIRVRILIGCLGLTLITMCLGVYSHSAQKRLGKLAGHMYDDTVLAISYLRSAQNGILRVRLGSIRYAAGTAEAAAELGDTLSDVRADLGIVRNRAMSPNGRAVTDRLLLDLDEFAATLQMPGSSIALNGAQNMEAGFDIAIEVFAADGFRDRQRVIDIAASSARKAILAVIAATAAAVCITAILSRSIVSPLRSAVAVAQSIAAGRLDNVIVPRGPSEATRLMRALSTMQASIAASLSQIQTLMAQQQSDHAGELAAQHATLEAALDNMVQGLCMFDVEDRLMLTNERFVEMFGAPDHGAASARVMRGSIGDAAFALIEGVVSASFTHRLDDGRTFSISRRPVAVGGWVATFEDVTDRHAAGAKVAHMARHDLLTGLPNRLKLNEHMVGALARARRDTGLAVLCLDLDRFKTVNDSLGHAEGDSLLRAVADRLRQCTRETDLVARLGADEFVVVQETAPHPPDATALANRIINVLSQPFDLAGHEVTIGISIGIALSTSAADTAGKLLREADLAMFRAKTEGRGAFCIYEPAMDAEVQARRELEFDLRVALQRDELEVFYQPLVVAGQGVCGFEALMRWRHPVKGLVSPAIFIPLAEELNLIAAMGRWILNEATREATTWPGSLKVAVNLSPLQFKDDALIDHVQEALRLSGLPADRLELEITESVLFGGERGAIETLHRFRAMGVRIAMDDFGTGYSSLSYLRRFPFDKIKIDQSFVRGMNESNDCTTIIRAVIGLGRSLGMAVNAEGVETMEQLVALNAEGCAEVQGFLFSKPVPATEITSLLRSIGNATMLAHPTQTPTPATSSTHTPLAILPPPATAYPCVSHDEPVVQAA